MYDDRWRQSVNSDYATTPESNSILMPTVGTLVDDKAGSDTSDLSLKCSQKVQVKLGRGAATATRRKGSIVRTELFQARIFRSAVKKLLCVAANNQTLSSKTRNQIWPTVATLAPSGPIFFLKSSSHSSRGLRA